MTSNKGINDVLERGFKETVVAYSKYSPGIYLDGLKKIRKTLVKIIFMCRILLCVILGTFTSISVDKISYKKYTNIDYLN
jgi:hypothetical protein